MASNPNKYDDIIHLPHHTSPTRPRMSAINRAAQFSPFAALTGYDAAVKETARLTDQRIELDEYEKSLLDQELQKLQEKLGVGGPQAHAEVREYPEVSITYFKADEKKAGGSYETITAPVKKIDSYERCLVLAGGEKIPLGDVVLMKLHTPGGV